MADPKEKDRFQLLLLRKNLMDRTQREYLYYYDKMEEILIESGLRLDQLVVDAFLDVHNNRVARAFLKNYLEFLNRRDLLIVRQTGRPQAKEQTTIPIRDMEAIRTALYDYQDGRYGLIFDLSESCALRRQEVLNIKAGDISIDANDNMFILIKMGKGNKERKVFVKDTIAVLVIHYLQIKPFKSSQYLFESTVKKDYPINYATWNKIFSKIGEKATGKKYHPHQLRGTRATTWYDQGLDIASIQKRLGHSDISTTMLYIKPDQKIELEKWSKEQ